jgi:hypothetical protein
MKVSKILHAVAVDLDPPAHFDRGRLLAGADDLREICPGLIAFGLGDPQPGKEAETTVRIAHFSVQEYLESYRIKKQGACGFAISTGTEREKLARVCCVYLLEDGLVYKELGRSWSKLETIHSLILRPYFGITTSRNRQP